MSIILILLGKLISIVSRYLNMGSGSTWPGHIILSLNKNFIKEVLNLNHNLKIVLIAGTNGKTTTTKLIKTILEEEGKKVLENTTGANLLNGIASVLISNSDLNGKINKDFAIFEIDENTLPLILKEFFPNYIILLNLFRDQLDRYGEVDIISKKWNEALEKLNSKTTLILNADDPQIAHLSFSHNNHISKAIPIPAIPIPDRKRSYDVVLYFGLENKRSTVLAHQHASDSTYCPNCGEKLTYSSIYFSHLGDWECKKCGLKHPQNTFTKSPVYPLAGTYNEYNINAAVLLTKTIGIDDKKISSALHKFKPAFGRQEDLEIDGKKVKIFLSKNPTSFNESLHTIANLNARNLLIILNDRIPDGRDVSWIWDIDFEEFIGRFKNIIISGDRAYDMGLRIKYSSEFSISNFQFSMNTSNSRLQLLEQSSGGQVKFQIEENLKKAISLSLEKTPKSEILYVLPTYSAMLEVRKILTGKKIL